MSTEPAADKPPFSIDAVMMGRNDEYEPRWNEKLVASIAHNRQMFEGSRVDYRVTFVEWNPPAGRPLLSPMLVERFPYLRAIIVQPEVHDALCESDQSIMLNFSLNCGLRTSTADYCLISAGDLFIGRQLAAYIRELGLTRNCLYRAERVNIRTDIDFEGATSEDIEAPRNIVSVDTCTEPPYDVPPYFHSCGDFLLTDRLSMQGVRGFDESIRFARLHLDSRFCSTCMSAGLHANLIGRIFHISHANSYTNQLGNYHDRHYGYLRGLPYLNSTVWGLADHCWTRLGERLWSVELPKAGQRGDRSVIWLSDEDRAHVNAVTRRIIAAKSRLPPLEPSPIAKQFRVLSPNKFRVLPHFVGASVGSGSPTKIETVSDPWGYSAFLNLRRAFRRGPFGLLGEADPDRVFWLLEIDAETSQGSVGFALLKEGELVGEAILGKSEGRKCLYIGASGSEQELLIRNVSTEGKPSVVSVYGVRLLLQPRTGIDEAQMLL